MQTALIKRDLTRWLSLTVLLDKPNENCHASRCTELLIFSRFIVEQ
jgi:hypothetical protein